MTGKVFSYRPLWLGAGFFCALIVLASFLQYSHSGLGIETFEFSAASLNALAISISCNRCLEEVTFDLKNVSKFSCRGRSVGISSLTRHLFLLSKILL